MGLVARQSFKSGIISYVGIGMGMLNTVLIYPFLLTVEELGVLSFINNTAMMLTPFVLLGFGQVILRYYGAYSDLGKVNYFHSLIVSIVTISTATVSVIIAVFADKIALWYQSSDGISTSVLFVLAGVTATLPLRQVYYNYCAIYGRVAVPTLLNNGLKFLTPFLALLYFFNFLSFSEVIRLLFIANLLITIVLRVYLSRLKSLSFRLLHLNEVFRDTRFSEMLTYALVGLLGGVGYSFANQVDILMIAKIRGTYDLGLYTWSFNIINAVGMPLVIITSLVTPMFAEYLRLGKINDVQKLYRQSSLSSFIISLGLFFGILVGIDSLFEIMPKGNEFRTAKGVFVLLGISKLFDVMTGVNSSIMLMSRYYKAHLVFIILSSTFNIILNILLIPDYGIEGCAIATIVSVFIFNILKVLLIWKRYRVNPFSIGMLKASILALFLFLILGFLDFKSLTPLYNIAIVSGLYISLFALISYRFTLSPEINQFVNKQLIRFGIKPFDK